MNSILDHYEESVTQLYKFVNLYEQSIFHFQALPDDLTPVEWITLAAIDSHQGITNLELANLLGRTPSAITQIVCKLEAKGFVERTKHKDNSKSVHLFLTAEGITRSTLFAAIEADKFEQAYSSLSKQFNDDDIERFMEILPLFLDSILSIK